MIILKINFLSQILGYNGPAEIVVWCVTKDKPYRVHPYALTCKKNSQTGVLTRKIDTNTMMTAKFERLAIQGMSKDKFERILGDRKTALRMNPFKYNGK